MYQPERLTQFESVVFLVLFRGAHAGRFDFFLRGLDGRDGICIRDPSVLMGRMRLVCGSKTFSN